jgi:hypothetical protein
MAVTWIAEAGVPVAAAVGVKVGTGEGSIGVDLYRDASPSLPEGRSVGVGNGDKNGSIAGVGVRVAGTGTVGLIAWSADNAVGGVGEAATAATVGVLVKLTVSIDSTER